MTEQSLNMDAYAPAEIATRVETVGVAKANLDAATMLALAVLAGAFIALGANVATILLTEHGLGYGVSRVAGGVVFSLGLMLVIVGGAELFTGNTLMVMAWASGKVATGQVIRNWMIVYAGNFTGALATAVGIYLSQQWTFDAYQVGATAVKIAIAKVSSGFLHAVALRCPQARSFSGLPTEFCEGRGRVPRPEAKPPPAGISPPAVGPNRPSSTWWNSRPTSSTVTPRPT